ncbi:MAG: hypothetical protein H8D94_01045 [Candidatus Pelagibacter sp.]|nr:hypothetical protein [Candidatus Pelagibacter sp.]
MYNLELVTILEKVLNKSYQLKNGEFAFYCPFCNHHKKKLQVNIENQKWHCWTCNEGGHKIGVLLRKMGAPKTLIKEALQLVGDYVSYEKDKKEVKHDVSLPREYKPLYIQSNDPIYKNAIYYLKQRRIGPQEMLRYSIGYCDSGTFSNRIIIPSYDEDGKLNYFIARDIFPNSNMKYKNPPMSKDVVIFELFINWDEDITITEGVMDSIAIKNNTIPLLGKFLSKKLKKKILTNKPPRVNVCLDGDAKKSSIEILEFLMNNGIDAYFIELPINEDASDIGFQKMNELIDSAIKVRFSDIISMKIGFV